jgi:hypothetical protein
VDAKTFPALVRAGLALAVVACDPEPRPWDHGDAAAPPAPVVRGSSPFSGASLAGSAAPASSAAAPKPSAQEPALPVRVGGPWVRCYGQFRPSGEPLADVTRLALLCGPENGMRRVSKQPFEGTVEAGGPPATEQIALERGACYRVFAVAEPSVADLDVAVVSSRGGALAADHGEDRWPIVQPDRPFCMLEDDRATIEVRARKGAGRFASETWVLRTPKRDGAGIP